MYASMVSALCFTFLQYWPRPVSLINTLINNGQHMNNSSLKSLEFHIPYIISKASDEV